jgi:hypothetical protein
MRAILKGDHMWRFPLAGLLSIGGMILLFAGFLGYPAMTVRALRAASLWGEPQQTTLDEPRHRDAREVAEGGSGRQTGAVMEPNAGATPAKQTETGAVAGVAGMGAASASTQPAATIVAPPVNRAPVENAPPWRPDAAPIRVHSEGPNTGPAAVFDRDFRSLFRASAYN